MLDDKVLGLDSSKMLEKVASLPKQLREGYRIAADGCAPMKGLKPRALVVAGMGGSAIGAEILSSYLSSRIEIPILICRDYKLPGFVDQDSLVVISSYSGDTEEALSCFEDAIVRKARVGCMGSGGRLREESAKCSIPFIRIPSGYPPRAALGYSFSALLGLVWSAGLSVSQDEDLAECTAVLEDLNEVYSDRASSENQAMALAEGLVDTIPLIYCSADLAAVGRRWKNQFCENSKKLAFVGVMPELKHNDIMGWEVEVAGFKPGVVFLRMPDEHPRISSSFPIIRGIVSEKAAFLGEYWSQGRSLLSRLFSLILLGDYASVYLALARGLDPTPIATIDGLKAALKESRAGD